MSALSIIRHGVEVWVLKLQIKDLKPSRIKSMKWIEEHRFTPNSYVYVVCNRNGEIKFSCAKQKYKIHKITEEDLEREKLLGVVTPSEEELLYEDYYSFPIVDYLEEEGEI